MKKIYCIAFFVFTTLALNAQDEGAIVKKERFELGQGIHIGGGPSFTLSKDIGNYSTGLSFEIGYVKRLNRVISIGPSVSYLSFDYDAKVADEDYSNIFIGGPYGDQFYPYYAGAYYTLEGGDLKMWSLSCNFKLNLIPVTDASVVSIYAFAKPFISYATRTEVKGVLYSLLNYGDPTNPDDWTYYSQYYTNVPLEWRAGRELAIDADGDEVPDFYFDGDGDGNTDVVSDELKEKSGITGGIFIGPGIEFMPTRRVSFYLQASIGYTLPVSFVNTDHYSNEENLGNDFDYFIENNGNEYPTQKKGFSSLAVQAGLTFNF